MNKLSEIAQAVKQTEDALNTSPAMWSIRYINDQLNPRVNGKLNKYQLHNFVDKLIFSKMPASVEDPATIRTIIEIIKKRWREKNDTKASNGNS